MITSEKLKAVLCDPEGIVCCSGSDEDRRIIQEAIRETDQLQTELAQLKEKCAEYERALRKVSNYFDCEFCEPLISEQLTCESHLDERMKLAKRVLEKWKGKG